MGYYNTIIIIFSILQANLRSKQGQSHLWANLRVRHLVLQKKASTLEYGYMKCRTHARVFSQTLAHEDSKVEIRHRGRR